MQYVLLLILLQILWSSTYVVMKVALGAMPPGLLIVFRYGIAAAVLVAIGCLRGIRWRLRDLILVAIVGLMNFWLSPSLQLHSLTLTRASDVAVLVAIEPLMAAILAAIFLHERFGWRTVSTFLVATIGVLIMSGVQLDGSMAFGAERLLGNALFLGAIISESIYSVSGKRLARRCDPLKMSAVMLVAGTFGGMVASWDQLSLATVRAVPASGWLAVVYLGIACTAFAYTAWIWLVKRLPVSRVTLSLFLQPVIGSVFGYTFLSEQVTWRSAGDAAITLSSLLVWLLSRLQLGRQTDPTAGTGLSTGLANQ